MLPKSIFLLIYCDQSRGCRGAWEELADWLTATYPWRSHNTSQLRHHDLPLLRLRPEDVGYAGVSSTSLADHVIQCPQLSPEVDQFADPLVKFINLYAAVLEMVDVTVLELKRPILPSTAISR